jgi:hypothetical protein
MRAILIGAALFLSACSPTCPVYRPFHFIAIDAHDFMVRHPGSELCLSVTSCTTGFQTIFPLDTPPTGPTRPDITVLAANGTVLLHVTPAVRTHNESPARGCEGSARGDVTIDADGLVSS